MLYKVLCDISHPLSLFYCLPMPPCSHCPATVTFFRSSNISSVCCLCIISALCLAWPFSKYSHGYLFVSVQVSAQMSLEESLPFPPVLTSPPPALAVFCFSVVFSSQHLSLSEIALLLYLFICLLTEQLLIKYYLINK